MDCEHIRAALSGRLDGEELPPHLSDDIVDAHVDQCRDCQEWYAQITLLSRRLGEENSVEDSEPKVSSDTLSALMLAEVEDNPQIKAAFNRQAMYRVLVRILLAVCGVGYLLWGVVNIYNATVFMEVEVQGLAVQLASLRFALAVGLFFSSWRPQSALGAVPIFVALWGFSVGFAMRDLILGTLSLGTFLGLVLHLVSVVSLIWCAVLVRYRANPFKESWHTLTAQPV